MNKPNETREHYETQARAALYPELVKALDRLLIALEDRPDLRWSRLEQPITDAHALLSRLPERDKGAG